MYMNSVPSRLYQGVLFSSGKKCLTHVKWCGGNLFFFFTVTSSPFTMLFEMEKRMSYLGSVANGCLYFLGNHS